MAAGTEAGFLEGGSKHNGDAPESLSRMGLDDVTAFQATHAGPWHQWRLIATGCMDSIIPPILHGRTDVILRGHLGNVVSDLVSIGTDFLPVEGRGVPANHACRQKKSGRTSESIPSWRQLLILRFSVRFRVGA